VGPQQTKILASALSWIGLFRMEPGPFELRECKLFIEEATTAMERALFMENRLRMKTERKV
jgi:hypothetical protein